MGYFYDNEGMSTAAQAEYSSLQAQKRDLQDEISLINLRREVETLRQQVGLKRRQDGV